MGGSRVGPNVGTNCGPRNGYQIWDQKWVPNLGTEMGTRLGSKHGAFGNQKNAQSCAQKIERGYQHQGKRGGPGLLPQVTAQQLPRTSGNPKARKTLVPASLARRRKTTRLGDSTAPLANITITSFGVGRCQNGLKVAVYYQMD